MDQFSFSLPVNIEFGCGKVRNVGALAKPYGKKALIVTGGSSAKRSGLYNKVKESIAAQGIESVLFDKVKQNPLTTTAEEGAAFANENSCDMVVAIGGGSIMDCAKAIALLAVNDGDVNDYVFGRISASTALPIVLIPTTCGTGSEGNQIAVLTNPANGDKKGLRSPAMIAKVSIVDPECMMTMPSGVLASVGFDALCHLMESYTSKKSQPITDAMCEYGMRLVAGNLLNVYRAKRDGERAAAYAGGSDSTQQLAAPVAAKRDGVSSSTCENKAELIEAWSAITLASTLGGMVISITGTALPHGMEHPASGLKDVVHGRGLAALTPPIIDATYQGCEEKFAYISRLFGGKDASDCADAIRNLLAELDLSLSLSDFGIAEADVAWMTESCMKVSVSGMNNCPVTVSREDVEALYRKAL